MLRRIGLIGSAALLSNLAACGNDNQTSRGDSSASGATLLTTTLSTTTPTGSDSGTTTDSAGTGSASETGGTTTAPVTTTDSTTTEEGSTAITVSTTNPSTSTGPNLLCKPGELQCADTNNTQTCAPDGLSWEPPVPCAEKTQCELGVCLTLCDKAKAAASSAGCEYYAIDANNDPVEGFDAQPYAVAVSNVDPVYTANVQVQVHDGNGWQVLQEAMVAPKQLHQFDLPDRHINYTGLNARGAYKVVSDVPIIAYQFQPVNGQTSYTSDASLLLPTNVLDQYYYVIGWGESSYGNAQLNIVASQDATTVTITPTVNTVGGGPIPALGANVPANLPMLNEADVIQLEANDMFSGTFITSDKPIAVFSTHWCANIPNQNACCCDHLEEQVYGLQRWGTNYVAARWPVRNNGTPEVSYWHLFASEDNTAVHIDKHAEVTGIPMTDFNMNKGQLMTLQVGGSVANPGDFSISADKPIYLMQYLSSSTATNAAVDKAGDPAMAQAVPVEQFRSNYVVLIPSNWLYDWLVITKKIGSSVTIDGAPATGFVQVGATDWEVARIATQDGVHVLDGDQGFGVVVLGYDSYDSYAYPGGLDQKQINPQ